jgi:hypothetical protein
VKSGGRPELLWAGLLLALAAGGLLFVRARGATGFGDRAAPGASEALAFKREIRPLLARYCAGCHGPEKKKADLDLTAFGDEASVLGARKIWKRVQDQLAMREMPPEDRKQPSPQERDFLVEWIDRALDRAAALAPAEPGRVVLRRLNRMEYRNTIRDLVGVDFNPSDDFPSDDVGYGFDNIGDVLSLPPLLMEKYFAAAERILDQAVVTDEKRKSQVKRLRADSMELTAGVSSDSGLQVLFANSEVYSQVEFPQEGVYTFRIRAGGDQAGSEPARMALKIDGQLFRVLDVPVPRSRMQVYEVEAKIPSGKHRLAAAFINDYFNPEARPGERDRNLVLDTIEIVPPADPKASSLPESHRRIFVARPAEGKTAREAAREVIVRFAARAWRRPLRTREAEPLLGLFDTAQKQGDSFESAVKLPLAAILVSPHFLFRVEPDRPSEEPRGAHYVGDYPLASRLSYFLWSTMPDDELFELAERGELAKPAVLEAQVARMLRDPRSRSLSTSFAVQWLQIGRLETVTPDPKRFPAWNDRLKKAMLDETVLFFEAIVDEDRSVSDLLDADFTYVNETLARHYGLAGVEGEAMRRVALADPRRGGILTMGSVLTVTSNPTRTSPVKRGKWVLESILGTPPPPPLPDAGILKEEPEGAEQLTVRQRLELHRADPSCASCHKRMDPIGIGFENYDAIGCWREKEGRLPLDVAAVLPDGRSFAGPVELKRILLTRREDFVRNLVEKILTYALGRGVEYYDVAVVKGIRRALAEQGYRFSTLVQEVVKSYPFQHRRNRSKESGEVRDD